MQSSESRGWYCTGVLCCCGAVLLVCCGVNVFWLEQRLCTYLNQISPALGTHTQTPHWCPGARRDVRWWERGWAVRSLSLFYNRKHQHHHSLTDGGNLHDSVLVIIYHFQLKTFSLARQTKLLVLLEWKPFWDVLTMTDWTSQVLTMDWWMWGNLPN